MPRDRVKIGVRDRVWILDRFGLGGYRQYRTLKHQTQADALTIFRMCHVYSFRAKKLQSANNPNHRQSTSHVVSPHGADRHKHTYL